MYVKVKIYIHRCICLCILKIYIKYKYIYKNWIYKCLLIAMQNNEENSILYLIGKKIPLKFKLKIKSLAQWKLYILKWQAKF